MNAVSLCPPSSASVEAFATPPADRFVPLSYADLQPSAAPSDFLWQGYLKPGALTLLTSLWKSGKTTLLSVLLARMKTDGVFAGLPLRQGRALVVSEENAGLWWERGHRLTLDGHVRWILRPFRGGKPTADDWLALIDQLGRIHDRDRFDLVAIDSLANLSPVRNENDSVEMLKAVTPLQRLTDRGLSVLVAHHPKKGTVIAGQAARGSGALSGYADILIEMHFVRRQSTKDRRRLLRGYSRYAVTPPSWVIEWTADGSDYLGLGPAAEPEFEHGWPVLQAVLEASLGPMTRRDILLAWPESAAAPGKVTLWKWLARAVKELRVLRDGAGTKKDPHRYSLPNMMEKWQAKWMEQLNRQIGWEPGR